MTGDELRQLRDDMANGSTGRLARWLGCGPETIRRNMERGRVSLYVKHLVDMTPPVLAFLRGLRKERQ